MSTKIQRKELLRSAIEQGTIAPAIVNYLGTGVNVFAPTPIEGLGLSIFDFSKADTKVVGIDGLEVEIPTIVNLFPNPHFKKTSGSKTSMEAVSNELATSVGVKAGAGLFSGGIKGNFKASRKDATYGYYTYLYESIGYAEMRLSTYDPQYFSDDFAADLDALPATYSQESYPQFASFFEKWGLYFLDHSRLGGELDATNAVITSSNTSTYSAETDINAQYQGLFYSGSFDASVTGTQSWASFSEFSETQFYIEGGTPATQGAIAGINPLEPSQQTVDDHTAWLESLAKAPAPVHMQFQPIASLAGNKAQAMNEAAYVYITSVQFATELKVSSEYAGIWNGETSIHVNGVYIEPQESNQTGFQVVVLDRNNPATIVNNRFFSYDLDNWENTYEAMYNEMYSFLQPITDDNIVVFSSIGVILGAFPTPNMQNYFTNILGCGKALQMWANDKATILSGGGVVTNLYYGVGVPNNGLGAGAAYYFDMYYEFKNYKVYRNLNGASLVLKSSGKTTIEAAD